jgi:hypothetical protein
MDLEKFIEKSKNIHADIFDYSLFEYTGSKTKSILICKKCGCQFLTTPSNNLIGNNCKNCDNIKKGSEYSKTVLESKYPNWRFDFSLYKNRDSEIKYICENKHEGTSTFKNLNRYNVCKKCILDEKLSKNDLEILEYNENLKCKCKNCGFIKEDSFRNLKNYKCKYCILLKESDLLRNKEVFLLEINGNDLYLECKNNHKYKQNRRNLLANKNCNECYRNKFNKEYILEKFTEIHGNYYKYNLDNYKSVKNKIEITCSKGHIFHQTVSNHLQGKGCPICRESIGERSISIYLDSNKIKYNRQQKFDDCKYLNQLVFDFYLPELNICIEYDGIQHFKPISIFGGSEEFEKTKIRDEIKNKYCLENSIKLYRISYEDDIKESLNLIFNYVNK